MKTVIIMIMLKAQAVTFRKNIMTQNACAKNLSSEYFSRININQSNSSSFSFSSKSLNSADINLLDMEKKHPKSGNLLELF